MKVNCIAIDDEPLALDVIADFSEKIPFLELKAIFQNPLMAIDFLSIQKVDLLFLDIEMEEISGIQFLKILKNPPHIIFTTAYENYALQGFDLDITDYLLKPFLFERFLKAVTKVYKKKLDENKNINTGEKKQDPIQNFMFVKSGFQHRRINFFDIRYIEGQGDYLKIVTNQENIMTLQSFKSISKLLPEDEFVRIHKSYIVAVRYIDSIERNRVKIGNKTISVSETFGKHLFELLRSKGFAR